MATGSPARSGTGHAQLPWAPAGLRHVAHTGLRRLGPALAGTVLPFALVLYLALKNGGYDSVVYSQVGIAAWWLVLLGALVGVLPVARLRPAAWVGLGLLASFVAWTALGIGWSDSAERSVAEVGRVASYLGVLALAVAVQGRDGLRLTVGAVAAAIGVVGALALLSRVHPAWFPVDETVRGLPETRERLNYPLNYWNGLAALMAIGLPLALAFAAHGRTVVGRALAGAAVPVLAVTILYTLSRGGIAAAIGGVIALIALSPRRLAMLPTLAVAGGGAAILIAGAVQREELADGLPNAAANAQGDEMLAMTLVVCAGVALTQAAIGLAARHGVGPRVSVSRPAALSALAAASLAALVAALALGLPREASDRWDEFKRPGTPTEGIERLESTQGNFRYQVWESAVDANATDPLGGIGPGTFEYWWARERESGIFLRDAHSLYLETLGELGIVGLALIVGLIASVVAVGARRAFRGNIQSRALLAGATAGCFAFAVAATVDWVWELAVLPVAFLLLAGAILGPARARPVGGRAAAPQAALPLAGRVGVVAVSAACLVGIAIPMAGNGLLQESQEDAGGGNLVGALDDARGAQSVEPFAAGPELQEALVLEDAGELGPAAAAAHEAIRHERGNWRNWVILSRIEAKRGRPQQAVDAYRRARSLNPRSPLFAQ